MNNTIHYATVVFFIIACFIAWYLMLLLIDWIKNSIKIINLKIERDKFFEESERILKVETKLQNHISGSY